MEGGKRLFDTPPAGTRLIGFYPAKYILQEIYNRIVSVYGPKIIGKFDRTRYDHVVTAIERFASKYNSRYKIRSISLSVLLGKGESTPGNAASDTNFIKDLGLETNQGNRQRHFYMFKPLILPTSPDVDVVINASGVDQYFIFIATPTEGLYHISIPIRPSIDTKVSNKPLIHYKEDVPDRDGRPQDQRHYYEFVPFDEPDAPPSTRNTIQYPNPSGINLQKQETQELSVTETQAKIKAEAEAAAAARKAEKEAAKAKTLVEEETEEEQAAAAKYLEEQQRKAAAAARKAEKEAAEAKAAAEAQRRAEEAAEALRLAEATRRAQQEADRKAAEEAEAVRKAAEEAALTPKQREAKAKQKAALAKFFKKKGGRSTRRKPRRALRKTRKAYI